MLRPRFTAFFVAFAVIVAVAPSAYAQSGAPSGAPSGGVMSKLPGWLNSDQPEFFRMAPFNVPMIRSTGVTGQISLMITLETHGLTNKRLLIEKRTIIQNAFLRDLYGIAAMNNRSGQPVNLNTVKVRLLQVSSRLLGAGVVKDILIANVYTRSLK